LYDYEIGIFAYYEIGIITDFLIKYTDISYSSIIENKLKWEEIRYVYTKIYGTGGACFGSGGPILWGCPGLGAKHPPTDPQSGGGL
jgi:hypothetical protein